jgi:hypothetical protein
MHQYHLPLPDYTGISTAISGQFLASNRYDAIAHAFLACDLYTEAKKLTKPTMLQSAWLARVNVTYAWWAHKRQAERAAIEAGVIPLVPPQLAKANGSALTVPPALVPDIDDMDLIHIAKPCRHRPHVGGGDGGRSQPVSKDCLARRA